MLSKIKEFTEKGELYKLDNMRNRLNTYRITTCMIDCEMIVTVK